MQPLVFEDLHYILGYSTLCIQYYFEVNCHNISMSLLFDSTNYIECDLTSELYTSAWACII